MYRHRDRGYRGSPVRPIGIGMYGHVSSPSTLLTGLLAGWKLDEAAGGPYADVLGVKTMTAAGSPGQAAGIVGNAVTSPDGNSYISRVGLLFNSAPWSMAGWFFNPTLVSRGGFFQSDTSAETDYNGFLLQSTGIPMLRVSSTQNVTGGTYSANTFVHLVGTYDGSTAKLYVNGVLRASAAKTAGYPVSPNWSTGIVATAGDLASGGGLRADEVYAWSKALTDGGVSVDQAATGEVAELYAKGLAGTSYPF